MEWVLILLASFVVLLWAIPLAAVVVGVLGLALFGHVLPAGPRAAQTTFLCPFSKRRANAQFLSWPGSERPTDVASCSVFAGRPIRCQKGCLELAETRWALPSFAPRYALLAGGVIFADRAASNVSSPEG